MKVLILGYSNIVRKRVLNTLKEKRIEIFVASKSYKKKITIEKIEIVKKRGGKNNIGWYF